MGTVLVTGASGFVGNHVCATLRAAGWRVRAAVRAGSPTPPDCDRADVGDVLDADALRSAACGAVAVVHLAGRAHVLRETAADPDAEFQRVNVGGTAAVMTAAAAAGAQTAVLLSSVAAAGEPIGRVDADTPPAPIGAYGASKLAAERVAADVAARAGMRLIIFRPPMIYGPGMKGNAHRLFRLVDRGVPIPYVPDVRRSTVHARNLAGAVTRSLQRTATEGLIHAADAAPTVDELVRSIAAALERPARLVRFPLLPLRALSEIGPLMSRVFPVPLTRATLRRITHSCTLDTSAYEALMGADIVSLDAGLRETASWWRQYARRHR